MTSNSKSNFIKPVPKCVAGFDVLTKIGNGSFAEVYKGIGRNNIHGIKVTVAIKCIPWKFARANEDRIVTEISLLKCCMHKHIVEYVDLNWNSDYIFIIMEFCGGGHLGTFIRQSYNLSEELARTIFHQLSLALCYMWKRHIAHMDLKPQNILIANRINMCIKVADFGLSQMMSENGLTAFRGSPLYMAPEICKQQKYDGRVDLWSAGIILYECLFGYAPFSSNSIEEIITKLQSSDPILIPQTQISYECRDLLEHLLVRNPLKRITFEGFFVHPFVNIDILAEDKNLAQARKFITQASVDEQQGNLNSAVKLLQDAVELYLNCVDDSSNNSEKNALRLKIDEYLTKAESIKRLLTNQPSTNSSIKTQSRTTIHKFANKDVPDSCTSASIQTRSQSQMKLISKDEHAATDRLQVFQKVGYDASKVMQLAQSIVLQARKFWYNSDGNTALTKYFEAIELVLDAAKQQETSQSVKKELREKAAKWISEAEDIKDKLKNHVTIVHVEHSGTPATSNANYTNLISSLWNSFSEL